MDNAMLISLSRQMTLRRAMDVTANNIANASTAGFKAERVLLEADLASPARHQDGPKRLAYVDEWGLGRDFSQGRLQATGRPLDLAIEGEGFFVLETAEGDERFTRDGAFTLDGEGAIVAPDGARLLNEAGAPILVDPDAGPVEISTAGEVSQNNAVIARLQVVAFEDRGQLQKTGANRFSAPEEADREIALDPVVRQGFTEAANVTPIMEITRMMEVSRAYASASRIVSQTDELSRKALERLGRP